ncbi:hypothetical protein [Arthrobacter sp. ISL-72]|uniref:hypothetical protein n=1 Tax=Arthrobacter sp. ISL-72 TaxID=2819114 RepID=UPI001BE53E0F|nr:hypothetical protein [Arthrobacter sp. ISL-72]MBT2594195.1 hypothetical protein [Arthrobacter sp. ISL-72]
MISSLPVLQVTAAYRQGRSTLSGDYATIRRDGVLQLLGHEVGVDDGRSRLRLR